MRGRRVRVERGRAVARPARGRSGRGIHPTSSSQVGRMTLGRAALAGVLGTAANIGSNASRCFAPLATQAVKGVDREGRGHPFAHLAVSSRGVVHPVTLTAIPSTPRKGPWGERMNGGSARGRSVIALGESRPLRGRRGREGRERAQCARSARVVSGEGIVPAPASQVGRENPGLAALAGVLGTTANIGWNASRCFAPLATLAVKGVARERRGHRFARLRRALAASFTR